jgi:hypothetical protein
MSQISTCPCCRLQVSLPQGVSPAARVKCPLCSGEYTLQEALDQVPPMLIILDSGPLAVMSEAAIEAELDAGSTGMLPQVEFPQSEHEEELPHFADDDDDARVALGDEAPAEDGAMIGGPLRRVAQDDDFDLDEERDGKRNGVTAKAGRRGHGGGGQRGGGQRGGGGFGEFVKVIVGAVVGLVIGYYILLLLGRDPMQLKPLVEMYLPEWLVPQ